jgi:protein-S-isoprenylcysteine O-methyltransferase Ste14
MLATMSESRRQHRRHGTGRWLAAGYAGLAGFFALEALLRQRGSASSLRATGDDRGTTLTIVAAYGLAAGLPLVARRLPGRRLPPAAAPAGLVLQAAGLAVRAWSMRALGGSYTRTLRTGAGGQALVTSGPYRLVRHPGYLGSLLTWTGFALASRSWPVVVLAAGLLGGAYGRRIVVEEQLLGRDIPGYPAYCQETRKLIPFVW